MYEEIKKALVEELGSQAYRTTSYKQSNVPVSVSARHVHLQPEHVEKLFGRGYTLKKYRDISQPGQYACEEKVTIAGLKGSIENVRILGPTRKETQVEVSRTDSRTLGVTPPVRRSGDISNSAPIRLIGPKGTVRLTEGCIIADRHIHMSPSEAHAFGVENLQKVSVVVEGEKGGVMNNVTIRVNERYVLDMHIDTDDANAFGLIGGEVLKIVSSSHNGGL
ncbi:phosphate propanoyltransferase [Pseudogracilibacillus sp. SE30717A]|uniref:phosphate propanoyltransferase n=1 Tax=Pseudogracilibacillus sp. SE30717A TaxID=3098293 RepID=UPI00300E2EFF